MPYRFSPPGDTPPRLPAAEPGERPRDELSKLPPGDTFVSPLAATAPEPEPTSGLRAGLAILGGAMLVSVGTIIVALVVRDARHSAPSVEAEPSTSKRSASGKRVEHPRVGAATVTAVVAAVPAVSRKPDPQVQAQPSPAPASSVERDADQASRDRPAEARARRARLRAERRERRAADATDRDRDLPAQPSRSDVIAAMKRITPAVTKCFGTTRGTATVHTSFRGKTGRVASARVSGQHGEVGSCIARAVRRAKVSPFAKDKLDVAYPFRR